MVSKTRPIDNAKQSGVNDAFVQSEKYWLPTLNTICIHATIAEFYAREDEKGEEQEQRRRRGGCSKRDNHSRPATTTVQIHERRNRSESSIRDTEKSVNSNQLQIRRFDQRQTQL